MAPEHQIAMGTPISVYFFTLTNTRGSEHIYMASLQEALRKKHTQLVDDPLDADIVHLFEVNFLTRDTINAFRVPELLRILRSETLIVVSTDDLYFVDEPDLTAHPRLYGLNHRLQRWLFNRCDAVIAISESVLDHLRPHVDTDLHVVHHGVDDRYFADQPEAISPYVLHVSLASKRKQPEAIRYVARNLDRRFVIAGSGWDEHIPDTPAYANVETPGFVPQEELVDLYARATVFYFPTLHEGFGLPILEAMAAGTAVVTTDAYAVPEVTGDAAVLCDPRDLDDHLNQVRYLLDHEEARHERAAAGRRRAEQFPWSRAAEETEAVYRSLL